MSEKNLETEVAIVKNDVNQIGRLFSKLEIALDKITDVNSNIGQMLAVHEQRLVDSEKEFVYIKKEMGEVDEKLNGEIKEIHSRLTTNTREIERKMSDEIDKVLDAIKDLKTSIDDHEKDGNEKITALSARLASLEKWRWILLGAFATGGFLLGNGVTFGNIFSLFT
tara:strand:- start:308 stop:808 length:501 start_codon:yes stop_codon:yes gene_type:complete